VAQKAAFVFFASNFISCPTEGAKCKRLNGLALYVTDRTIQSLKLWS